MDYKYKHILCQVFIVGWKIIIAIALFVAILFGKQEVNMATRIHWHIICLFRRPKNWKFYIDGIKRELFP